MFKEKIQRFSIRKLSVGAASVLIGLSFMAANSNDKVKADDINDNKENDAKTVDNTESQTKEIEVVPTANPENAAKNADKQQKEVTTLKVAKDLKDTTADSSAKTLSESKIQNTAVNTNNSQTKNETKDKAADTYSVKINIVNDADATGKNPVIRFEKRSNRPTTGKWFAPGIDKTGLKDGDQVESVDYFYTIPGYKLLTNIDELTSQFKVKDGNLYVDGKDVNVTLHYAPLSSIKVEYVNEANGDIISSADFPTWRLTGQTWENLNGDEKAPIASRYEAAAITIPGYELVSEPIIDGQVGNDVKSKNNPNYTKLIFKYRKVMDNEDSVTTSNKNGENNWGAPVGDYDGWDAMPLGFQISGVYGSKISAENGDVEQKIKDVTNKYRNQGYTYVGMTGIPKNNDYYNYIYYGTDFYLVPNKPVTVNYVDEQGNKLAASDTISFNKDNPDQTNNGINIDKYWAPKGTWETKPKDIDGYYLEKVQGAEKGDFTAYNYITTYVYAKKVKGQVTYIDDTTKKTLATDPLAEAKPGDKIDYTTATKIQNYLNSGYKLAGSNFTDGNEVYKAGENANNFEVHLVHDYIPVEPKNPGKPGKPINPNDPEGPKFPNGTDAKSLTKTITRTVDYVDENGKSLVNQPIVETVTLQGAGVLDKVTGEWTTPEGLKWNSSNFDAITTPNFPTYHVTGVTTEGNIYYTVDKATGNVAATPVTHENGDTKVIVQLSRDEVNGTVKYIDDITGETLKTDEIGKGKIGSEITYTTADKIKNFENKGYALSKTNFVDGKMHYQKDNNNYEVHLVHQLIPVDPKNPGKPGEPINPNAPEGPKFPNGTDAKSLQKTITRTVNYVDENGNSLVNHPAVETVTLQGAGVLDKVTGKWQTALTWNKADFKEINTPSIPNYHVTNVTTEGNIYYTVDPKTGNVSEVVVDHTKDNTNVTVHFAKNETAGTVKYIDDVTGQVIKQDDFNGKIGEKITYTTADKIKDFENKGYKLVKTNFQDGSMYFNKEGNNYEVHFVHQLVPVDPKNPGKPGEPINPNDPEGPTYPQGTDAKSLTKKITRTVNYVDENGNNIAGSVVQTATMTGAGVLDKVTGKWNKEIAWKDGNFESINTPSVNGYHVTSVTTEGNVYYNVDKSNGNVSSTKVTHNDGNTVVNVHFTKDTVAAQGTVTYIDDTTGKTLQVKDLKGNVGEKINYTTADQIKSYEDKGYKLVSNNFNDGNEIFAKDGNKFEVHLAHDLVPVTPEKPGKPGEPINPNDPEGPTFPQGTDAKSLTKEITRVINYVDENGKSVSGKVTQKIDLSGQGVIDKVTGEWQTPITWNKGSFDEVAVPNVDGSHVTSVTTEGNVYYNVDNQGNVAKTVVTHENGDTEVTVHFTKDTPTTPVIPDQPTPEEPTDPEPETPAPHGEDTPITPSEETEDVPAPHGQDIPTDPSVDEEEPETVMPHATAKPEAPKAEEETVKPHAAALPQTGAKQDSLLAAVGVALLGLMGIVATKGSKKRRN